MDTKLAHKITLAGFSILIASLFYYQVIRGEHFLKKARANYIRVVPKESIRGSIKDRNSVVLASDRPIFNIAVIPYQIHDKNVFFQALSKAVDIPLAVIKDNYRRNVGSLFSPVDIVVNVEKEQALILKEKFPDDLIIKEVPRRYYSFGYAFSHILGYVKRAASFFPRLKSYGYTPEERVGILGVEQYYDAYLRGIDGGELLEVDSRGRVVGFLGISNPVRGKNITLTVDAQMQYAAYEALGSRRGVIIMMNPHSGEVFVLCSRPSYNLNNVIEGINLKDIFQDSAKAILNRAIQLRYPLGSIFKPVVALGALQENIITKHTSFHCLGEFSIGDYDFQCWDVHGRQDLRQALLHSCNVYFYNTGLTMGIDLIAKWARILGLGQKTGIDLPYEKAGIVPDPKWKLKYIKRQWFKGDTVNVSIGQGYIEATPLGALVALSVFANGGYLVKPYLLKTVEELKTQIIQKNYLNISEEHLASIKEGLRAAVADQEGTAHTLDALGLGVAGKTGTAQNPGRSHGWFVGYFPYTAPRYSLCVFLENAGSSAEALKVGKRFLTRLKEQKLLE